jgi:energy-converting hydrogenase B subunit D
VETGSTALEAQGNALTMIETILILLLVLGFLALHFKDLISAVIALAVFSLLSALLFYLLHAPDVAIAEAAVGAGVATVIFVWAIGRTERRPR